MGLEIGRRWGESDPPAASEQRNLLASTPPPVGTEQIEVLLEQGELKLERIHSCAASTPEGQWYDQEQGEWVSLLQGSAQLRFEDEPEPRQLPATGCGLPRTGATGWRPPMAGAAASG